MSPNLADHFPQLLLLTYCISYYYYFYYHYYFVCVCGAEDQEARPSFLIGKAIPHVFSRYPRILAISSYNHVFSFFLCLWLEFLCLECSAPVTYSENSTGEWGGHQNQKHGMSSLKNHKKHSSYNKTFIMKTIASICWVYLQFEVLSYVHITPCNL